MGFDITRHVEGVQSVHADEKHMLNLVSLANVREGRSKRSCQVETRPGVLQKGECAVPDHESRGIGSILKENFMRE